MKVQKKQLLESVPALERLKNEKLPIKTAFKIVKILKVVRETAELMRESFNDPDVRTFETKRLEILRKYSRKNEKGEPIVRPNGELELEPESMDSVKKEIDQLLEEMPGIQEKVADFYTQLDSFMAEEIDVDIEQVPISDLEGLSITSSDLELISYAIAT